MFFDLDAGARGAARARASARARALERLLPGPLTLVLPNPAGRFPLACGADARRLGLRVPALTALEPLGRALAGAAVERQPRRRRRRAPPRRRDPGIRAAVDLELDGGELPGHASTVVDLDAPTRSAGDGRVLRQGARAGGALAACSSASRFRLQQPPAVIIEVTTCEYLPGQRRAAAAPTPRRITRRQLRSLTAFA